MPTKQALQREQEARRFRDAVDQLLDAIARQPEDSTGLSMNSETALARLWWGYGRRGHEEVAQLLRDLIRAG